MGGSTVTPRLYIGTCGLSVWFSNDFGQTFERLLGTSGLYSETRVWALNWHPDKPGELLTGTNSGIHRLDLATNKFQHVPSPMDSLEVWSIARSPSNPDLIIAGSRPGALFRSTDDGKSWKKIDAKLPETCMYVTYPRVTKILFDPQDHNLVWASLELGGVFRSEDAGLTWKKTSEGLISDDVHDVGVMHNGGRVLFATTNEGLHVSHDGGDNWNWQQFASKRPYTRTITPRADDAGVAFMTNGDGPPGSWGRLLRTRDYGKHWENAGLPGDLQSSAWLVAANRANPNLLFASSALGQYFRSDDGGESWEALPRRLTETRALAWVPVS
jgi:photosystem II stability/assembly factor-like uncharacterized protein